VGGDVCWARASRTPLSGIKGSHGCIWGESHDGGELGKGGSVDKRRNLGPLETLCWLVESTAVASVEICMIALV